MKSDDESTMTAPPSSSSSYTPSLTTGTSSVEEVEDPHSSKFRAGGQLMSYEEEPNFEGYLQLKVCVCVCVCDVRCSMVE